jgi:ribosomal-protein-alanine N-acetyltransferase
VTSSSGVALRRLGVDDLEALAALEAAAHPLPWTDAALLVELVHDDAVVWGAFDVGAGGEATTLVGHVVVRRLVDEAWVLDIATHPAARRRGIARRLIDAALAAAQAWTTPSLWLEVREGNSAARALYERCGFVVVGRRPGYYPPLVEGQPREAAVLMRRDVPATAAGAREPDGNGVLNRPADGRESPR